MKMNFRNAKARQPEIIRSAQKDEQYTTELTEDFSDLLRLTGQRNWIKYNSLCKLLAEISYHGFASLNNLQTLGEEYTGIIQIDSKYQNLPSIIRQLTAIILEFGGETLYEKVLKNTEKLINENEDIIPESKTKLLALLSAMRSSPVYVKALHKTLFYFRPNKYRISKRISSINYVLVRHWLKPDQSLYGYTILGLISSVNLAISLIIAIRNGWKEYKRRLYNEFSKQTEVKFITTQQNINPENQCILCLELRKDTSLTPCGHLYCWYCILEWLDDHDECPLCREAVKKSNVIPLQNYV